MLIDYNLSHEEEEATGAGWWHMYRGSTLLPLYWQYVYKIANALPRSLRVLEIGAGFGFVTSIFAYLGYKDIVGFERVESFAASANARLKSLFGLRGCIRNVTFKSQMVQSDLLVLVNCVYSDGLRNKEDYIQQIKSFYAHAGAPRYFILEVIDSSYTETDETFPPFVRLSKQDVSCMFPSARISSKKTYEFPRNKTTKALYFIEQDEHPLNHDGIW